MTQSNAADFHSHRMLGILFVGVLFELVTAVSICGKHSCDSCISAREYVPHWKGGEVLYDDIEMSHRKTEECTWIAPGF